MSVEPLKIGKSFIKIDNKKPIKTISENEIDKKHYYQKQNNGNINVNDLFTVLINKIDSLGNGGRNIYGEVKNNMEAIEVDIKKDLFIGDINVSKLESEVIEGKVKTKKDKLKALRQRNKK